MVVDEDAGQGVGVGGGVGGGWGEGLEGREVRVGGVVGEDCEGVGG